MNYLVQIRVLYFFRLWTSLNNNWSYPYLSIEVVTNIGNWIGKMYTCSGSMISLLTSLAPYEMIYITTDAQSSIDKQFYQSCLFILAINEWMLMYVFLKLLKHVAKVSFYEKANEIKRLTQNLHNLVPLCGLHLLRG